MAFLRKIFEWVFYGHLWIALGAASLGWVSQGVFPDSALPYWLVPLFLFLATLGVYTLHRLLSFQRAEEARYFRRYQIVYRHPQLSQFIGWTSLLGAGFCCLWFPPASWISLSLALPFTFFYLIPVWPGGKRLRDYSYLKVVWVALSWTLMTAIVPMVVHDLFSLSLLEVREAGGADPNNEFPPAQTLRVFREIIVRFFFTLSVAILFDFRDVKLDASQSVHTLANQHPGLAKMIVYTLMIGCVIGQLPFLGAQSAGTVVMAVHSLPYLFMLPIAWLTNPERGEDWYAVVVNGVLILPGLMLLLGAVWLK